MIVASILLMVCCVQPGCQRKSVAKDSAAHHATHVSQTPAVTNEAEDPAGEPANSRITGKVVKVIPADRGLSSLDPCAAHPCRAKVQVMSIEQYGMNYHGQFESGDVLEMVFDFTLSPTEDIFPVLDTPLKGLDEGSVFTAELYERPGADGDYRIKLYEVKQ